MRDARRAYFAHGVRFTDEVNQAVYEDIVRQERRETFRRLLANGKVGEVNRWTQRLSA